MSKEQKAEKSIKEEKCRQFAEEKKYFRENTL